jgi:hypothetical protein
MVCLIDGPLFPSRVSNRWPAISVPRRIVSITTINGISMVGVPCGTRCSNI